MKKIRIFNGKGEFLLITHWMLKGKYRQYVIKKVKTPLMRILVLLAFFYARKYPEPTKQNTVIPNTHILIDIRDEFLKRCDNPGRKLLFEAIWRVFICQYEHDPYYSFRINWIIKKIKESQWRESTRTKWNCWKDDDILKAEKEQGKELCEPVKK